jgi:RNA polymerase sigma-70 factor (ECF subfamily)
MDKDPAAGPTPPSQPREELVQLPYEAPPRPQRGGRPAAPPSLEPEQVAQFAQFFRDSASPLIGYLIAACGASPAEAAECVQETLTLLVPYWARVTSPMAWCRTVAKRCYYQRKYSAVDSFDELPTTGRPLIQDNTPVEQYLVDQMTLPRLLEQLPLRQREVMAMTIAGAEPSEIAEELGVDPTQVRSNLYLARKKLKELWLDDTSRPEV